MYLSYVGRDRHLMKRSSCRLLTSGAKLWFLLLVSSCALNAQVSNPKPAVHSTSSSAQDYRTLLNRYCVVCHNEKAQIGGLMLDKADLSKIPEQADIWEKVERKLRSGMMPPVGMPRPDATVAIGLASMLETKLDEAALAKPNPGLPTLRRLTRTEYGNAIRDLLGMNVDVSGLLPGEGYSNEGFDNDSAALGVSPVLMERYISAAWKISGLAVGSMKANTTVNTFKVRSDESQNEHIDGLPVGTRGGILVHYYFPVDGEYIFRARLWRNNVVQVRGLELPTIFELSLDGARVHVAEFGGPADEAYSFNAHVPAAKDFDDRLEIRLKVKAGPHDVGYAFLMNSSASPITLIRPLERENLDGTANTGIPTLAQAIIVGPMNPIASGDTATRTRIFVCRPPDDDRDAGACARKILVPLARVAYRRPVTKEEEGQLLHLYEVGRKQAGGEAGIETALSDILASPQFIFRAETDPANAAPGSAFVVNDYDLASRLSFFIWSSIPDDELLALAGEGRLKDPAVLEQQVRRMLKGARSSAMVLNFADQWLRLRNLKAVSPNDVLFPDFDDNLRQAFQRETELFFDSILRENRNVLDLINANYTFLNQRLAAHYGVPHVEGSQFRRVTLTDPNRFGLLGQGSILTVTSYGNRTSPVVRGKFVLSIFMGNPPPPMPANVPPLNETVNPDKPLSMRQRMDIHRANPVCANCHRLMDPIGFALENFDATGKWRTSDNGAAIDPAGTMANGAHIDGPVSLRKVIADHPEQFVRTLTEALMTYALGRKLEAYDMPAVRAIVRKSSEENYTLSSLIEGIVKSTPFQMKIKVESAQTPVSTTQQNSPKPGVSDSKRGN